MNQICRSWFIIRIIHYLYILVVSYLLSGQMIMLRLFLLNYFNKHNNPKIEAA